MEGIYNWLGQRNCYARNTCVPRTHTIMSGGILYVSDRDYDEFLSVYAEEIKKGNKTLTFSELRSDPVFNMYFDIDILDEGVLTPEYVKEMISVVHRTMKLFFPSIGDNKMKCVVCTTQCKDVDVKVEPVGEPLEPGGEPVEPVFKTYKKNGYHIVYPFVRVDFEKALQLRFSVVSELKRCMGERSIESNPWSDVMDKAPYHNGLKMCGSVKTIKCSVCKGASKKSRKNVDAVEIIRDMRRLRRRLYTRHDVSDFDYGDFMNISKDEFKNPDLADMYSKYVEITGGSICHTCGDKGMCLEKRFYMPEYVMGSSCDICEDSTDLLKSDLHETMRWTSIRYIGVVLSDYVLPPGFPVAPMESPTSSIVNFGRNLQKLSPGLYREVVNSDMFGQDAEGIKMWKGDEITDSSVKDTILKLIRSLDQNYAQLEMGQVFIMNVAKSVAKIGNVATKGVFDRMASTNNAMLKKDNLVTILKRVAIRVHGTGSTYCCNKGSEHNTNNVYFWMSPTGISQRCFSRKDIVGKSGNTCQKYIGNAVKVPRSLKDALFHEEVESAAFSADLMNGMKPDKSVKKRSIEGGKSKSSKNMKSKDWTKMY